MQQTKKYQFNLIESSDPFSAQPLNDNMEKVEAALDAADAAVKAAVKAADTAVAAHRTEVNAALSAQAAQVDGRAQFAVVRRTGDGGPSYTVTFPFQPKVVMLAVLNVILYSAPSIVAYGQEQFYVYPYDMTHWHYMNMVWAGNSLTVSANVSPQDPDSYYNRPNCQYVIAALA